MVRGNAYSRWVRKEHWWWCNQHAGQGSVSLILCQQCALFVRFRPSVPQLRIRSADRLGKARSRRVRRLQGNCLEASPNQVTASIFCCSNSCHPYLQLQNKLLGGAFRLKANDNWVEFSHWVPLRRSAWTRLFHRYISAFPWSGAKRNAPPAQSQLAP